MKRTAILMSNVLARVTLKRFGFGIIGGVAIPGVLLAAYYFNPGHDHGDVFAGVLGVLTLALTLAGELLERRLFFSTVVAHKMPGGVS